MCDGMSKQNHNAYVHSGRLNGLVSPETKKIFLIYKLFKKKLDKYLFFFSKYQKYFLNKNMIK